jgi:hypothetical protein
MRGCCWPFVFSWAPDTLGHSRCLAVEFPLRGQTRKENRHGNRHAGGTRTSRAIVTGDSGHSRK